MGCCNVNVFCFCFCFSEYASLDFTIEKVPSRRLFFRQFEKCYFNIVGSLFHFNNDRYIRSFTIRIVEDLNEITHHVLECLYLRLKFVRGPLPGNDVASNVAAFDNI